jgi:hypothetical protein
MSSARRGFFVLVLVWFLAPASLAGAWQPPKDNVLTDAQVAAYLQILKSALDDARSAGATIDKTQSPAAAVALIQRNNVKFKANLAGHNMSEEEYHWVADRITDAWGATLMTKAISDATGGIAEQRKKSQEQIDGLKAKITEYQKAQAAGRRVMTKDECRSAIDSAKGDQQSALDEAKQHDDEIKQATEDASKADSDAKAADALARNPPPDVGVDDRQGYIDGKKADAQAARDAAKEARGKLAEAKKAREESLDKADAAKKKMANPDLPATDEEKAQVRKENEDTIASLNTELSGAQQNLAAVDKAVADFNKSMQDQQAKNPIPPQNVALFKKHEAEFDAAWGVKPVGR